MNKERSFTSSFSSYLGNSSIRSLNKFHIYILQCLCISHSPICLMGAFDIVFPLAFMHFTSKFVWWGLRFWVHDLVLGGDCGSGHCDFVGIVACEWWWWLFLVVIWFWVWWIVICRCRGGWELKLWLVSGGMAGGAADCGVGGD